MVSNNPQKIGQDNSMHSLPTGLTQITKTGNVGSVDFSLRLIYLPLALGCRVMH